MEAPYPLDAEHLTSRKHGPCRGEWISINGMPRGVDKPNLRSARRTSDGLSVKATVIGSGIFAFAFAAHREICHRRVSTFVGNAPNDAETRATRCTTDQRVIAPPVPDIGHFSGATITQRQVRGDPRINCLTVVLISNEEPVFTPHRYERLDCAGMDQSQGRTLGLKGLREQVQIRCPPLGFYQDTGCVVAHEAAKAIEIGEPAHRWPEADALHAAANSPSAAT